jgi:hypothetical protein
LLKPCYSSYIISITKEDSSFFFVQCPMEGISGKSQLPMLKNSSIDDDMNVVQWRVQW